MMETKELLEQSVQELKQLYTKLSKEIFDLKNELSVNRKLEKPHKLRHAKRDRARVLTVLRQKEFV